LRRVTRIASRACARHVQRRLAGKIVTPAHAQRLHCPSPANAAFSKAERETVPPSQANVMRLARVIIEPESGRDFVEFLAADNLRVSFVGQRKTICAETTGINGALTNR
jgi:hypothetical protein